VLRVEESDVRNMVRRNELRDISSDGRRRLDPEEVIALVEQRVRDGELAGESSRGPLVFAFGGRRWRRTVAQASSLPAPDAAPPRASRPVATARRSAA
jgi:hypothetical protein